MTHVSVNSAVVKCSCSGIIKSHSVSIFHNMLQEKRCRPLGYITDMERKKRCSDVSELIYEDKEI